jgi:hypothetical protein
MIFNNKIKKIIPVSLCFLILLLILVNLILTSQLNLILKNSQILLSYIQNIQNYSVRFTDTIQNISHLYKVEKLNYVVKSDKTRDNFNVNKIIIEKNNILVGQLNFEKPRNLTLNYPKGIVTKNKILFVLNPIIDDCYADEIYCNEKFNTYFIDFIEEGGIGEFNLDTKEFKHIVKVRDLNENTNDLPFINHIYQTESDKVIFTYSYNQNTVEYFILDLLTNTIQKL